MKCSKLCHFSSSQIFFSGDLRSLGGCSDERETLCHRSTWKIGFASRFSGGWMFGITGIHGFEALEIGQQNVPKNDESGMIRITSLGIHIFQAWILLLGGVNHFDPQPHGSCRWVHILTVAASIFQFLGGGSAWVRAETVGKPGEMMQFTFVDFAKLDFVEWKHCRASKMVRYFGLVFAINWGTFDIVWGAKFCIIYTYVYVYVIHK